MKAKPIAKKRMPQRQVSTMHSIRTLTVSRERQKPASSMVKPTCIPNTRNAATNVQTVLSGLTTSAALTTASAARTRPKKRLEITDDEQYQTYAHSFAGKQELPVPAPLRITQTSFQAS